MKSLQNIHSSQGGHGSQSDQRISIRRGARLAPTKIHKSVATLLICLMTVFAGVPGWAQSEDMIIEEIGEVWQTFEKAFIEGRADILSEEVFAAPSYFVVDEGGVLRTTPVEVQLLFKSLLEGLIASGYAASEVDEMAVCVLNPAGALISIRFTRYQVGGEVLSSGAATYVFSKLPQGWRIVSVIPHRIDQLVRCGE